MKITKNKIATFSIFGLISSIFIGADLELYKIASGTGEAIANFSVTWLIIFIAFTLLLSALVYVVSLFLWQPGKLQKIVKKLTLLREKNRFLKYLLLFLLLILPVYMFQYTIWGLIFTGIFLRVLMWGMLIFLISFFLATKGDLFTRNSILVATLLVSTVFVAARSFSNVSDYPFNLFWSDGNRIWDYSLMFGRHLYNYPADQPLEAYIDKGRQFLWGLPFLLPKTSILFNRFWSALVLSLPYAFFGWSIFHSPQIKPSQRLFFALWTFLFLNQGPIYTPLIISAILLVWAWKRPLWLGIPLLLGAALYAQASRVTWLFAPAMWIGMLELSDISLENGWLPLKKWTRVISLTFAGLLGGFFIPAFVQSLQIGTISSRAELVSGSLNQPLLWHRLLPNETYGLGILLALVIAIGPLLFLLKQLKTSITTFQKFGLGAVLLAFLAVGLVASTKIGGGNNLHNLDMFLVGLVFLAAIFWAKSEHDWFSASSQPALGVKIGLLALILVPAFPAVRDIRPNMALTDSQIALAKILTDSENISTLPPQEEVNDVLWYLKRSIDQYAETPGDILFIDGRQLLTFGYVSPVPLVPEYEKKRMMDEAMSSNAAYFAPYYQDLTEQRFSLIISEPLKVPEKEEGSFSEEGDAWNRWVAAPTLCFYEPLETFKSVYIQLLVPRTPPEDCSNYLSE